MQDYIHALCNDVELMRALKITSIGNFFTTYHAYEPSNFFKMFGKFGKSWCADLKTAQERYPALMHTYPETVAAFEQNFATLIVYIGECEDISIDLHKLVSRNNAVKVIVIVSAHAHLDLVCKGINALASIVSLTLHIEHHAQVRIMMEDSNEVDEAFCAHITARIGADAKLEVAQYQKQGNHLYFFDYYLQQSHASVKHISYGALANDMYQAITTRQFHQAEFTQSDIAIKTVLDGAARSFYRGTIAIDSNGAGSIAQQQHRALLVNEAAYTCGIPSLEVETHEVRCTHGTAASSIDEQLVWYLQSRGLSYAQARQFLVRSFLMQSSKEAEPLEAIIAIAQQRLE